MNNVGFAYICLHYSPKYSNRMAEFSFHWTTQNSALNVDGSPVMWSVGKDYPLCCNLSFKEHFLSEMLLGVKQKGKKKRISAADWIFSHAWEWVMLSSQAPLGQVPKDCRILFSYVGITADWLKSWLSHRPILFCGEEHVSTGHAPGCLIGTQVVVHNTSLSSCEMWLYLFGNGCWKSLTVCAEPNGWG